MVAPKTNIMNSPISDMLIRIKNAQAAGAERVLVPHSGIKFQIANILKEEGYLAEVSKKKHKARKAEHDWLDLELKSTDGSLTISGVKIVSKPSRHLYIAAKDIRSVRSGYGIAVLSTSKGVMTSKEARKQGVGGEILFEIW